MARSPLRFDVLVYQGVPWPDMLGDVQYLARQGIGTVWLPDHYAWIPSPSDPLLETWTTLAALAATTTGVRLGSLISNVAMRHPAMLAKQAATVDNISSGRLDLGLGPGYFEREQEWFGVPSPTPSRRVDRLREAVEVIDGLLREHRLTYSGEYYRLDDAPLAPVPVQEPRPPLVIAAKGKRALRIVADYADTWVWEGGGLEGVDKPLQEIRERNHLLDQYCAASGRDPQTLERAYYAGWAKGEAPFVSRDSFQNFVGQYRESGVQRFIFTWNVAGIFEKEASAGLVASRETLEAFAAQAMAVMRGANTMPQ